jgi:hypothetical protein
MRRAAIEMEMEMEMEMETEMGCADVGGRLEWIASISRS